MIIHPILTQKNAFKIIEQFTEDFCLQISLYCAKEVIEFIDNIHVQQYALECKNLVENWTGCKLDYKKRQIVSYILDDYCKSNIETRSRRAADVFFYLSKLRGCNRYNVTFNTNNIIACATNVHIYVGGYHIFSEELDLYCGVLKKYRGVMNSFFSQTNLKIKPQMAKIPLTDSFTVLALLDELEELGEDIIQDNGILRLNLPEYYDIVGNDKLELADNIIKDELAAKWLTNVYNA